MSDAARSCSDKANTLGRAARGLRAASLQNCSLGGSRFHHRTISAGVGMTWILRVIDSAAAIIDQLVGDGMDLCPRQGSCHGRPTGLRRAAPHKALARLNPLIAEQPGRVDEVLPKLRAVALSAVNDGVVAANERMTTWLRGHQTLKFIGTDDYVPVRLLDFEQPDRKPFGRLRRGNLWHTGRQSALRRRALGQRPPVGGGRDQDTC